MKRQHAQMTTKLLVFCNDHTVDERPYHEYVANEEIAMAWIALHDLQWHGRK